MHHRCCLSNSETPLDTLALVVGKNHLEIVEGNGCFTPRDHLEDHDIDHTHIATEFEQCRQPGLHLRECYVALLGETAAPSRIDPGAGITVDIGLPVEFGCSGRKELRVEKPAVYIGLVRPVRTCVRH